MSILLAFTWEDLRERILKFQIHPNYLYKIILGIISNLHPSFLVVFKSLRNILNNSNFSHFKSFSQIFCQVTFVHPIKCNQNKLLNQS